jgi:hypothetical protein
MWLIIIFGSIAGAILLVHFITKDIDESKDYENERRRKKEKLKDKPENSNGLTKRQDSFYDNLPKWIQVSIGILFVILWVLMGIWALSSDDNICRVDPRTGDDGCYDIYDR